ncbi:MAG: TolC family protein [Bacteriovorax sp.]
MKKSIGFVVMFGLFSAQLYAGEQYSLEKAREQVANNNIKLAIAYEQYVLVKSQAQAKTLQILPTISADLLVNNYQYTMLRSLIPEPAKFFEAAAQKDLARAADMNRTIVKKNLLEDLEETLFLFQFHKEMVESFNKENQITNEIAARSQEAYDLGAISFSDYYKAKRDVVAAETQMVSGNELVETEEYALKLILQVKDNTDKLDIDTLKFYNGTLDYPTSVQNAMTIAVNNSKEVEQFDYLINAANKQKRGAMLSWLSWSGVGFDYFTKISIDKLQAEKIGLDKKKSVYEIKNQVAAQYAEIESHKEKMAYQSQLLDMARAEYVQAKASEVEQLNSFINTKKAELSLMYAEREDSKLKYELELKYIKLKRLLGTNMMTNVVPRT